MMNFPDSPLDGQAYTNSAGLTYYYSAPKNVWTIVRQSIQMLPLAGGQMTGQIKGLGGAADDELTTLGDVKTEFLAMFPIGSIQMWASTTVPNNWLECDGGTVDAVKYPTLAGLMATVPDLRGEFVRGLDSGRGVDTGRAINSAQKAETEKLFAAIFFTVDKAYEKRYEGAGLSYPSTIQKDFVSGYNPVARASNPRAVDVLAANDYGASSKLETRPRNISLMYIIKAI